MGAIFGVGQGIQLGASWGLITGLLTGLFGAGIQFFIPAEVTESLRKRPLLVAFLLALPFVALVAAALHALERPAFANGRTRPARTPAAAGAWWMHHGIGHPEPARPQPLGSDPSRRWTPTSFRGVVQGGLAWYSRSARSS